VKRLVARLKKEGGAQHVFMQADGNVRPLVDLYLEAGITGLRSIEPRAGMDPVELRRTYGKRLVLVGAIDNNIILPSGDKKRIKQHVLYTLQAARGGGMIIGPESISQDISVYSYLYYLQLLD
ncbi:MAG: uroporphyrinogen decarboxylase family protein, partial [Candidatus Bathyarchaeia archaeon]